MSDILVNSNLLYKICFSQVFSCVNRYINLQKSKSLHIQHIRNDDFVLCQVMNNSSTPSKTFSDTFFLNY